MNTKYTMTHDIDWFYYISGKLIHVASAGDKLPKGIKSLRYLHDIQNKIDLLPEKYNVELNRDYITHNIIERDYQNLYVDEESFDKDVDLEMSNYHLTKAEKLYYSTYVYYARRGLYSFDRTDINSSESIYHLVARPIFSKKRHDKFVEIKGIPQINTNAIDFNAKIDKIVEIDLIQIIDNFKYYSLEG